MHVDLVGCVRTKDHAEQRMVDGDGHGVAVDLMPRCCHCEFSIITIQTILLHVFTICVPYSTHFLGLQPVMNFHQSKMVVVLHSLN
jgi:hypothetical protein